MRRNRDGAMRKKASTPLSYSVMRIGTITATTIAMIYTPDYNKLPVNHRELFLL